VHAVRHALRAQGVASVVVVAPATHLDEFARVLPHGIRLVAGGAERTDSVAAGLAALDEEIDVVLVHDAARALAPPTLFDAVARAVRAGADAVVPGLPVTDTIKQVDGRAQVLSTPDRAGLRAVQTPQGFRRAALEAAHATGAQATDDAALVESNGGRVVVIDGDPLALKVTTPPDLETAERLLAAARTPTRPWLVVLGGLPGVGKTTLARALATRTPMVHLRVDTIEQSLIDSGEVTGPVQIGGYAVAYRVAGDQLGLGLSVIADMVNPVTEVRAAWEQVARRHDARLLRVDLICSDEVEHHRRVSTRESDIETLQQPTWEQVQAREVEPWRSDLRLDTAYDTPEQLVDRVLQRLNEQDGR